MNSEYVEKACAEYPILKAQLEIMKNQAGGTLFKINEYASAIKEIARENAKLKFKISDLEEENALLKYKLDMKEASNYCLTLLGKDT